MMAFGRLTALTCCVMCVACAGDADRTAQGGPGATADTAVAGAPADAPATPPVVSGPTLRIDGIGDIEFGITVADAADRAGTTPEDPDAGAECRYITFPTLPEGVALMVIADTVRRVDVDSPDVPTDRGATIGMTTARIEDLYGAALERMPHKYEPDGEYLIVSDGDRRLVFETANDTVLTMRAGLMPHAMWVERCG